MIWNSLLSRMLIDLTVVGLASLLLVEGISQGVFSRCRVRYIGRYLLTSGVLLTALYYLVDLAAITVLPLAFGPAASTTVLEFLTPYVRVPGNLVSFAIIVTGAILVARQNFVAEDSMRQSQEQVARAVASVTESEERFRSLVERTDDAVSCFEFTPPIPTSLPIEEQISRSCEGVLVEYNEVYANRLGGSSHSRVVGKLYESMDTIFGVASREKMCRSFIQGDYRLIDHNIHSTNTAGERRALRLNITGVVRHGELVRVWVSEKDILPQIDVETDLQGRLRFQQLVTDVSSRLITVSEDQVSGALEASLKQIGYFGMADHVILIWFSDENNAARLLYHWTRKGDAPKLENSLENYPWMTAMLVRGDVVAIESVAAMSDDIKDKNSLVSRGIESIAVIPVVIGGKVVGGCGFLITGRESEWSDQDIWDMQILADLLANVVNRLNAWKSLEEALAELRHAQDRLEAENVYLRHEIRSDHGFNELIGASESLLDCLQGVAQVAPTNMAVLVQGETGTGKELIVRAIHERSDRSERALVKVNCAALPANLIESELFGHEKGAFTGADSHKRGRFDLADRGTLFLDEIGDLPFDLQGKLLRVLQEGEFERVGGNDTIRVDVRIIAATNRVLQEAVDHGDFRADLFYRINTFSIILPPLRERVSDIPVLVEHFIGKHAPRLGKEVTGVSSIMMEQLQAFSWPGNIRELESVVQRALISASKPVLHLAEPLDKKLSIAPALTTVPVSSPLDLRSAERKHIAGILEKSNWKIAGASGAAATLGLPPSTLRSKMKKLGIERRG